MNTRSFRLTPCKPRPTLTQFMAPIITITTYSIVWLATGYLLTPAEATSLIDFLASIASSADFQDTGGGARPEYLPHL